MSVFDVFKRKRYKEQIDAGLTRAYGNTQKQPLDLDERALVFVSDLYKGTRDGADDFWISDRVYRTALSYYYVSGFRLFVLGDVEELWENLPGKVIEKYGDTLRLEGKFHADKRYERLWGNHDDLWKDEKQVAKHLHGFYSGLKVHEALKFRSRATAVNSESCSSSTATRAPPQATSTRPSHVLPCVTCGAISSALRGDR